MHTSAIFLAAALIFGSSPVTAHMEMSSPIPFRSKFGANKDKADFSMTSPLGADQALCKGYAVDLADPALGAPTATFKQGEASAVELAGSAAHGGGSCQLSLSTDGAKTFTVIQSIMGGCPATGVKLPFTIPADAPVGKAIFSWSWVAKLSGVPEFYQNCAPIEITAGAGSAAAKTAFKDRPAMFVANINAGNGCKTVASTDPLFPNPGPDVTGTGTPDSTINCGTSSGPASPAPASPAPASPAPASPAPAPASSAPASSAPASSAPAPASSAPAPASSAPGAIISIIPVAPSPPSPSSPSPAPAPASSSISPSSPSASPPPPANPSNGTTTTTPATPAADSGTSTDGSCGAGKRCPGSNCCSALGFCGTTPLHCGTGCQRAFGACAGQSRIRRRN
ncbi:uncharacterized protein L3040_005113 [Drepanopeziza brunnea f. sp. 'multigermtubi']|uniref:Endoglucanase n=1 Tax=Marssonina brunnea f. sp. multigermtubi (strain MB_m1) TaxID=1072389 RepID=K1W8W0_MARBU|nr:endoglucanase [Drepanopeziza brunnea f. sp. 'multigermtubi' MB_m1]EKD13625.1 endoglucanase [Drepanopeziza brunnea f. sp. 'multigermtubi' MB_m1]KAJ5041528.1 hypothetical protein L3040_005113 [Drepanopeziza brunnea f. sp. 'multigermtubi']